MAPIIVDAPLSESIRANKKHFKKSTASNSYKGNQKRSGAAGRSFGAKKSGGGNGSHTVRVNITNLAATVTLEDIKELFTSFKTQNISVNANGTGSVTLPQKDAFRLIEQFKGVAIDGVEMRFSMSISSRVAFPGQVPKRQKAGSYRKSYAGGKKAAKVKNENRSPRQKMSKEELDAALEAYMS